MPVHFGIVGQTLENDSRESVMRDQTLRWDTGRVQNAEKHEI